MVSVPFSARVLSAFAVAGRGPFVEIAIVEGTVRVGDFVRVRLDERSATVRVDSVEFVDHADSGNPALGLTELEGSVVVGSLLRGVYPCPCCRYLTILEPGGFEICPVCFWEDDGQGDHDADVVRGGPNALLSLTDARKSFEQSGACDELSLKYVRAPRDEEVPR